MADRLRRLHMNPLKLGLAAAALVAGAALAVCFLVLPPLLLTAERIAPHATPQTVGVAFEEVSFETADGVRIDGWWMDDRTPAGIDPFTGEPLETEAVLVFVHGASANRADPWVGALDRFRHLTGFSHHVLAIDLRNSGTSGAWQDGRLGMGAAEAADVIAAVDYAEARAPGLPVIAFGASMGGAAVLHAAARDARIRGLVLLDPVLDGRETLVNGAEAVAGLPRPVAALAAWAADTLHGAALTGPSALDLAIAEDRPLLVIQDARDPINRRIHAETLAAANRNVDLWIAPHPDDPAHPHLAGAGPWGTHVAAFKLHEAEAEAVLEAFLTMVHAICRAEDAEAARGETGSAPLAPPQ